MNSANELDGFDEARFLDPRRNIRVDRSHLRHEPLPYFPPGPPVGERELARRFSEGLDLWTGEPRERTKTVSVYRNLHKRCWSVMEGRRVAKRVPAILLEDVEMVVQEGGKKRAQREGKKNVHAFCRGEEAEWEGVPSGAQQASYSPWVGHFFLVDNREAIVCADRAWLNEKGELWVSKERKI